eukprot:scaffold76261_cov33-Tisochrysis_lutea.AAC.1
MSHQLFHRKNARLPKSSAGTIGSDTCAGAARQGCPPFGLPLDALEVLVPIRISMAPLCGPSTDKLGHVVRVSHKDLAFSGRAAAAGTYVYRKGLAIVDRPRLQVRRLREAREAVLGCLEGGSVDGREAGWMRPPLLDLCVRVYRLVGLALRERYERSARDGQGVGLAVVDSAPAAPLGLVHHHPAKQPPIDQKERAPRGEKERRVRGTAPPLPLRCFSLRRAAGESRGRRDERAEKR